MLYEVRCQDASGTVHKIGVWGERDARHEACMYNQECEDGNYYYIVPNGSHITAGLTKRRLEGNV